MLGLCCCPSSKKISLSSLGKGPDPVRVCTHCYAHEARRTACLREYIPKLMQGSVFKKYPTSGGAMGLGSLGKANPRVVRLSGDQKSIIWHKQGESQPKASASINVSEVTSISQKFTGVKNWKVVQTSGKAECCFSVIAHSRSLDLECGSVEERNSWITCFGEFVKFAKLESPEQMRVQTQASLQQQAAAEKLQQQREERKKQRAELRAKYATGGK